MRAGEIRPFESIKLDLVFAPTVPGEAKLDFSIKFSDTSCKPVRIIMSGVSWSSVTVSWGCQGHGTGFCLWIKRCWFKQIPIQARGTAVSIPVWVVQPNVDLKICMFDRLYQDAIVVQSRWVAAFLYILYLTRLLVTHNAWCRNFYRPSEMSHLEMSLLMLHQLP